MLSTVVAGFIMGFAFLMSVTFSIQVSMSAASGGRH